MKNIEDSKKEALQIYKEKKNAYLQNQTKENWIAFCDAKMACMRFGVII